MPINYEATKTLIKGLVQKMKSFRGNWEQNDPTADDYIKNRPFYTEGEKEVVIVPEMVVSISHNETIVKYSPIIPFEVGKTYNVLWNGNNYSCVAHELNDIPALGDSSLPFCIAVDKNIIGGAYIASPTDGDYTVLVTSSVEVVHKIDRKYIDIPTNLATTDDVQSVANDVQTVANNVNKKMNATNPVGTGSFSMNRKAGTTVGRNSHTEGYNTTASGEGSHAEGNATVASGEDSHAEGIGATASGDFSHAEGYGTKSSGQSSHAEGDNTTAYGQNSHAEGYYTIANGRNSHAEGFYTTANKIYSHAEGNRTIASGKAQHVEGVANIEDTEDKYIHIAGNGVDSSNRSNAHTLDWSGNAWFQGDVYVSSTSGINKDEGSKKLVTEDYVSEAIETLRESLDNLASKTYVDTSVASLVNSAPETLDTLGELATAMEENESVVNALNQAIANKADSSTVTQLQEAVNAKAENSALNEHTTDSTIHITAVERAAWNSKMDGDSELISIADIDAICGSVTPIAEVLF